MKSIVLVMSFFVSFSVFARELPAQVQCRAELENGDVKVLNLSFEPSGLEVFWGDTYVSSQLDGDNFLSQLSYSESECSIVSDQNDLNINCLGGTKIKISYSTVPGLGSAVVHSLKSGNVGFQFDDRTCVIQ